MFAACEPLERAEAPQQVAVPADLEFEVLNPARPQGLSCSPDVSVSYKVPVRVIEALTHTLLDGEIAECSFGVIAYYLPHMKPGTGAWAVADFMPEVEATILGLGALEEKELVAKARQSASTVGTWIDDTSYAAVVSVVQDGAGIYVERHYRSGDIAREEIVFGRYAGGTGFENREDNGLGRHYVVNSRGFLETHDDHGRLSEARLYRMDRDIDRLIVDERERQRQIVMIAANRAEQVRESGNQRRLDAWRAWLEVFRDSMEPVRHFVMRMAAGEHDAQERVRNCAELAAGLAGVPASIRDAPPAAIDMGALEVALSRVAAACEDQRWVGVLVESRSAAAIWREFDRTLYLVAQQYRQLESGIEPR